MGLCFPHLRAPQIGPALLSVLSNCFSLGVQLLLSSIGFAAEAFPLLPEFLPRSVNTGTEQEAEGSAPRAQPEARGAVARSQALLPPLTSRRAATAPVPIAAHLWLPVFRPGCPWTSNWMQLHQELCLEKPLTQKSKIKFNLFWDLQKQIRSWDVLGEVI